MKTKLLPTLQKSAGLTDDFMSSVDELKSSIQEKIEDNVPTDTKDDLSSSIADFKAFIQNNINAVKPPTDTNDDSQSSIDEIKAYIQKNIDAIKPSIGSMKEDLQSSMGNLQTSLQKKIDAIKPSVGIIKDDLQASIDEVKAYIQKNIGDIKQYSNMNPELTNSLLGGTVGLGLGGLGALYAKDWRLPLLAALGGAGVGYASTQGGSEETGKTEEKEPPKVQQEYTPTNKNLVSGIGALTAGGAAVGGGINTYQDYTKEMGLRTRLKHDQALSKMDRQAINKEINTVRGKSRRNALLSALAGAFGVTAGVAPQVMGD